jgi:ketosteroid isomerase-like protein
VNALAAAQEHVAAFNAWDTDRVVAGFAPDAVWVTGQDRFVGTAALTELFDPGLWDLRPHLAVRTLLVDGSVAALEVVETLTLDGEPQVFAIAAFLEFGADGLIRRGTVYREGRADL